MSHRVVVTELRIGRATLYEVDSPGPRLTAPVQTGPGGLPTQPLYNVFSGHSRR